MFDSLGWEGSVKKNVFAENLVVKPLTCCSVRDVPKCCVLCLVSVSGMLCNGVVWHLCCGTSLVELGECHHMSSS